MAEERHSAVAIVGGGPVGMMLALTLARHGVGSVLFNIEENSRWHPKGSTHNSRSMEHYRRLGLAAAVRATGLPHDHPTDVAYFTRYAGWELARLRMPSEAEKMATVAASPTTHQVPEPIHRANQMYVEKLLFDHLGTNAAITRRYGWRVDEVRQDDDGVSLKAERGDGGDTERWRVRYLIGCDGGQSFVRRALAIRYSGFESFDGALYGGRMIATWLRLPTLMPEIIGGRGRCWQYVVINDGMRLVLVSLNGTDEFLLFTKAPDPNAAPDEAAIRALVRRAIGRDIPIEVLGHNPWTGGTALVADRFGAGRVLLAGDAVHLFTPSGGFGMNTGIDDTANLGWKLAAMIQGWGGPRLLASYEVERKPIATRNTGAARAFSVTLGDIAVPPGIELDSEAGAAVRHEFGHRLATTFGEEYASLGVQLGARYDGSPIIVGDGAPPTDDPFVYRPSSVPGGRAPHFWVDRGRGSGSSLFDRLGLGFTLLCLGRAAPDARALAAAAAARAMPLDVLHCPDDEARALYERDFALIRPDQHVAWRGNALPPDPDRLLARVTGAA